MTHQHALSKVPRGIRPATGQDLAPVNCHAGRERLLGAIDEPTSGQGARVWTRTPDGGFRQGRSATHAYTPQRVSGNIPQRSHIALRVKDRAEHVYRMPRPTDGRLAA